MRVGIVALLQESNTFIAGRTTLEHFEQDVLLTGAPVRERMSGAPHEVGGFFAGLAAEGVEAVPVFAARAMPFGVMTAGTFDALMAMMTTALDAAGPLDGILAAPHGATVSESVPDVDGYWLAMLRRRFGPGVPIIATLDLHANLSQAMVGACDAIIGYRTNPHLDQRDRGREAAMLIARTLRGESRPVTVAQFLPLAVNIERQATSESPGQDVFAWCDECEAVSRRTGLSLRVSALFGFPYADVTEMGAAVVGVGDLTDGSDKWVRLMTNELASACWQSREQFVGRLIDVDTAVSDAASSEGPVGLLDMGDNVGGGSPGDGTLLLHALARHGVAPAIACLADAESAAACFAVGVGGRVRLSVGGKTDRGHGEPFAGEFTVEGLYDGRFSESEARHGGFTAFDQGPTAVASSKFGLTVMLTTRRVAPFSLRQLTAFGIDPARFQALVVKGVHAPAAAYAPVCRRLIRVNTPGVTCADLTAFEYKHRRRPMYPFEPDAVWQPS
jgi:microcystin degradation protein MlrC